MNKLVIANLLHRPLRSIISVLAVAIEVVMILSIVAIFMGMLDDQKERTNGIGADLVVSPSNASFMNGVSGAPMSIKLAECLSPHAARSSGLAGDHRLLHERLGRDSLRHRLLELQRAEAIRLSLRRSVPGSVRRDRRRVFARAGQGHHVGDTIIILNHPFRICGIVESGKGGRKLVPIDTLGGLMGSDGKASVIYLKSRRPCQRRPGDRRDSRHQGLGKLQGADHGGSDRALHTFPVPRL